MPPVLMRKTLLKTMIDPEKTVSTILNQEVTIGPNQKSPLHIHPCPTIGIITKGEIAFQIEGKLVQHLKAGDTFYEPANVRIARFDNEEEYPAKFIVYYLLGKGEYETIRILAK